MYELRDRIAEADLVADAHRGVNVRVILDQHLERAGNTDAYNYLTARGVHVTWGPPDVTVHQKTLTFDGTTAVIMTLNLVTSDYPTTRDFAVVDTNHDDIDASDTTFDADYTHTAVTPPDGADLVWSPTNARITILATIGGATRTLEIENEEMSDTDVVAAIATDARRGVNVEVTLTANRVYDTELATLVGAGVHVHLYPADNQALYIHAKAAVADAGQPDERALVGSTNFSYPSITRNRELSIDTTNAQAVAALASTLTGGMPEYRTRDQKPALPLILVPILARPLLQARC